MIWAAAYSSRFLAAWTGAFWNASWQGAIAIGLVWAVCRCLPKISPRLRCWLWRLALLKMALAVVPWGTLDLPWLPDSWSAARHSSGEESGIAAFDRNQGSTEAASSKPATADAAELSSSIPPQAAATANHDRSTSGTSFPNGQAIVFLLWSAVVVVYFGAIAWRVRDSRRWRREWRLIVDRDILTLNEQLSKKMGLFQPPVLFEADSCKSPILFGALKTAIVLPARLVTQSTPNQLQMILGHEMAHIRRGDLLYNWLSTFVSGLFFFHPCVWLALRESQLAQESACDELAVRQPEVSIAEYGRLLVDLADRFREKRLPVVAVGVVETFPCDLKRRLLSLKSLRPDSRRVFSLSWMLAFAAIVGLLPWRLTAQSECSRVPSSENASDNRKCEVTNEIIPARELNIVVAAGAFEIVVDRAWRKEGGLPLSLVPSGLPYDPTDFALKNNDIRPFSLETMLRIHVRSPKPREGHCWIGGIRGKVRCIDDRGRSTEFSALPTIYRLETRMIDAETDSPGAIFLGLPSIERDAKSLRSVEGELVLAEAIVNRVTFTSEDLAELRKTTAAPLEKKFTVQSSVKSIFLTDVEQADDGINILLGMPRSLESTVDENSPESLRYIFDAFTRLNVVLCDNRGGRHVVASSRSGSSDTIASTPTLSVSDGNYRWTAGFWASRPAYPCSLNRFQGAFFMHQFHFDPLPDGLVPSSLICTITDCPDPPVSVPFRLENVQIPDPRTRP